MSLQHFPSPMAMFPGLRPDCTCTCRTVARPNMFQSNSMQSSFTYNHYIHYVRFDFQIFHCYLPGPSLIASSQIDESRRSPQISFTYLLYIERVDSYFFPSKWYEENLSLRCTIWHFPVNVKFWAGVRILHFPLHCEFRFLLFPATGVFWLNPFFPHPESEYHIMSAVINILFFFCRINNMYIHQFHLAERSGVFSLHAFSSLHWDTLIKTSQAFSFHLSSMDDVLSVGIWDIGWIEHIQATAENMLEYVQERVISTNGRWRWKGSLWRTLRNSCCILVLAFVEAPGRIGISCVCGNWETKFPSRTFSMRVEQYSYVLVPYGITRNLDVHFNSSIAITLQNPLSRHSFYHTVVTPSGKKFLREPHPLGYLNIQKYEIVIRSTVGWYGIVYREVDAIRITIVLSASKFSRSPAQYSWNPNECITSLPVSYMNMKS